MKKNYFSAIISLFFLAGIFLPAISAAQNKDSVKAASVKELVTNRRYTFKAQTASPMSGRLRQLNSDYDLQVLPDKIISQLPYYGRAYAAPINLSGGGVEFTSKEFDYTIKEKKKDGWEIAINFKDVSDTKQMQLTIFSNGTASLQVTSNNREAISFNGFITTPRKIK